jgi:hypothetical protein
VAALVISEETVERDMGRRLNRIRVISKTWREEGVADITPTVPCFILSVLSKRSDDAQ